LSQILSAGSIALLYISNIFNMAEPKSDFSGTDRQSDLNSITVLNADLTGANQSEEFELQSLNREIQNAVEPVVLRSRLRLALVMAALYVRLVLPSPRDLPEIP
jgi:hypothetical protein